MPLSALFSLKPMLYGVFLGTVMVAASFSWPVAWIGLELNLMAFIPLAISNYINNKGAITYFVSQSCGSLMILLGGIVADSWFFSVSLLLMGVVFKIGLIPLHFWVPCVVINLTSFNLYLLISWQKIGPIIIVMTSSVGYALLCIVNAVGGAVAMSGVTVLPLLLIFSGIVQIGWVFITTGVFTFYYLFVYYIVLSAVVLYSAVASVQFGWALLNAGGLPPFSGFIINLNAILHINGGIVVLLVGASGLALSSYIRLLLNTRLKSGPSSGFLVATIVAGSV